MVGSGVIEQMEWICVCVCDSQIHVTSGILVPTTTMFSPSVPLIDSTH